MKSNNPYKKGFYGFAGRHWTIADEKKWKQARKLIKQEGANQEKVSDNYPVWSDDMVELYSQLFLEMQTILDRKLRPTARTDYREILEWLQQSQDPRVINLLNGVKKYSVMIMISSKSVLRDFVGRYLKTAVKGNMKT
jgi:hypothetical protein